MDDDKDWFANVLNDPARDGQLVALTGEITLYPFTGYSTALLSPTDAMLTVEFAVPPPAAGTRILRLGMTRQQCTELSQALARLAILPYKSQSQPS
jgi:hypothetical protein